MRMILALLSVLVAASPAAAWLPFGPGTPRGWQQTTLQPGMRTAFTSAGSTGAGYQNDVTLTDLRTGAQIVVRPNPDYPTETRLSPCSRDGGSVVYVPQWDRHVLLGGWAGGYVRPEAHPLCIKYWEMAAYSIAQDHWDRRPIENYPRSRTNASLALHPPTGDVYYYGSGGQGCCKTNQIARFRLYAQPDANGNWGTHQLLNLTGGPFPNDAQTITQNHMNGMVWVPPLNKFLILAGRGEAKWGAWLIDPVALTMTPIRAGAAGGVFPPYRETPR